MTGVPKDGLVTEGMMWDMAVLLQHKLGRKVRVHRSSTRLHLHGKVKIETRYALGIEGCLPEVFHNMTVNELKSRIAMITDLILSGVVAPCPLPSTGTPTGRASYSEPVMQSLPPVSAPGDTSPPTDDRY